MPIVCKLTQIEITPDGNHILALDDQGNLWVSPMIVPSDGRTNESRSITKGARPEWSQVLTPTR